MRERRKRLDDQQMKTTVNIAESEVEDVVKLSVVKLL